MLARKPKSPATYADLEALPANMVGQLVFGVLHAHPRPAPRHGVAATSLADEIVSPFQKRRGGPGGWLFSMEPELHLGPHVIVPDIAGWRRERLPRLPDTAYIATHPDWVCEVLSPATARLDRTDKLSIYAEFKVGHCWLVDPDALTLEVFELREGRWTLHSTYKEAELVAAPPFSAHSFALDVLWPDAQTSD
jgi:Uma2 family endonuclease